MSNIYLGENSEGLLLGRGVRAPVRSSRRSDKKRARSSEWQEALQSEENLTVLYSSGDGGTRDIANLTGKDTIIIAPKALQNHWQNLAPCARVMSPQWLRRHHKEVPNPQLLIISEIARGPQAQQAIKNLADRSKRRILITGLLQEKDFPFFMYLREGTRLIDRRV